MDHKDAGTRVTEPELDEALARVIRLFIHEVVEASATPNARSSA